MSEFLEGYGVTDERRERRSKKVVYTLIALVVLGVAAYFGFRDIREKRQANRFVALIQQKNFEQAYRLWGCDPAKPCRDYNFEKFVADWSKLDLIKARSWDKSCTSGMIRTFEIAPDNKIYIWIDKSDRNITFSPFDDSCRQPIIQR